MIEFPIVILVAQDGKAEEDGVDGVEDGGEERIGINCVGSYMLVEGVKLRANDEQPDDKTSSIEPFVGNGIY